MMSRSAGLRLFMPSSVFLLIAVAGTNGCATRDASSSRWWREGLVVRTLHRSEITADLESGCAQASSSSTPPLAADNFALVQFKAGRAPYTMLFPVKGDVAVKVGDHVQVEPGACRLLRGNAEGA